MARNCRRSQQPVDAELDNFPFSPLGTIQMESICHGACQCVLGAPTVLPSVCLLRGLSLLFPRTMRISCKLLPWLCFPRRLGCRPLPAALGSRAHSLHTGAGHTHSATCIILAHLSREGLTERVLSSSQKIENGITIWSSNSFSGHIPKKLKAIELKARAGWRRRFSSCAQQLIGRNAQLNGETDVG